MSKLSLLVWFFSSTDIVYWGNAIFKSMCFVFFLLQFSVWSQYSMSDLKKLSYFIWERNVSKWHPPLSTGQVQTADIKWSFTASSNWMHLSFVGCNPSLPFSFIAPLCCLIKLKWHKVLQVLLLLLIKITIRKYVSEFQWRLMGNLLLSFHGKNRSLAHNDSGAIQLEWLIGGVE